MRGSSGALAMHKTCVALALLVSLGNAAPSLATEPGTPMDCSDLELAGGLTCTNLTQPADDDGIATTIEEAFTVDNGGRVLAPGSHGATGASCGTQPVFRREHVSLAFGGGSLVASTDRCAVGSRSDALDTRGFYFDSLRGSLYVSFKSFCLQPGGGFCGYFDGVWLGRIDGFAPLADVLPPPPLPQPLCSNGLDDDGDGQIDAADAHCKSDADNDESRP
jgi:hypothetical protein